MNVDRAPSSSVRGSDVPAGLGALLSATIAGVAPEVAAELTGLLGPAVGAGGAFSLELAGEPVSRSDWCGGESHARSGDGKIQRLQLSFWGPSRGAGELLFDAEAMGTLTGWLPAGKLEVGEACGEDATPGAIEEMGGIVLGGFLGAFLRQFGGRVNYGWPRWQSAGAESGLAVAVAASAGTASPADDEGLWVPVQLGPGGRTVRLWLAVLASRAQWSQWAGNRDVGKAAA
jgi:hypothetical protein